MCSCPPSRKCTSYDQIVLIEWGCSELTAFVVTFDFKQNNLWIDLTDTSMMMRGGVAVYSNVFSGARVIISTEGSMALYKGMSAAALREMSYSSLRFGLYEPFKSEPSLPPSCSSSSSPLLITSSPFLSILF